MNLVKKSLYLCIGVLLMLLGLQGAQSLYQVSRLSAGADDVVASSRLSGDARQLWARFLDAEQALKRATAFVDAASADDLRQAFAAQSLALRNGVTGLQDGARGELQQGSRNVSVKVEAWLALAGKHVGAEGVTELPSYHLLDAARADVDTEISALVLRSAEAASATIAANHALARSATLWTLGEMFAAVALGVVLGWRALKSLHGQLGADASEVARVANAVADGDLTVPIATQGVPAGSVMAAMARMQHSLQETVSRVLGISGSLTTGSNEIATGNSDLSQRTEQQAAALERTASTMAQLGTTVKHNADNATQASQLADQASAVATRGGTVVGEAVETMRGINDSSRKIADIIGVIDGIAFQTNILALNAAVEAARAGEQGRGFAVVAAEVRSLAQRSAAAAREIKTLITDSVERVETGSALVDRAGQTMDEVVQAIGRVTAVMAEIRHASVEQNAGVAQVGQSVAELDQATQQNAALAEQSATAAESLKAQGQQLAQAMTFFKVAGSASAAVASTARTPQTSPSGWQGDERRGPGRAKNVVRPTFTARSAGAVSGAREEALPSPAKTGTDDARQAL
jgi:methyl-accepting chemotaxis protein